MKRKLLWTAAFLVSCAAARATPVCSVSTSGVAFGSFNPLPGASADTVGTISVTCTGTAGDSVSYTLTLSAGLGSFTTRKMLLASNALYYNLYTDSGCTQIWGDTSSGTVSVADAMTGLSSAPQTKNYSVYSRIASGQNHAKGGAGYSDSLLVTLAY